MNNWLGSLYGSFERLLRWAYPGGLFLLLLYLGRPEDFYAVSAVGGNTWFLLFGGLIIGAAVYLVQVNVLTQLLSALAQWLRWDVGTHPGTNSQQARHLRPVAWLPGLRRLATDWFDPQAHVIERRQRIARNPDTYQDYAWATFHSTMVTGWLALLFFFTRENSRLLAGAWYVICAAAGLLLIGACYLFLRLARVRS